MAMTRWFHPKSRCGWQSSLSVVWWYKPCQPRQFLTRNVTCKQISWEGNAWGGVFTVKKSKNKKPSGGCTPWPLQTHPPVSFSVFVTLTSQEVSTWGCSCLQVTVAKPSNIFWNKWTPLLHWQEVPCHWHWAVNGNATHCHCLGFLPLFAWLFLPWAFLVGHCWWEKCTLLEIRMVPALSPVTEPVIW